MANLCCNLKERHFLLKTHKILRHSIFLINFNSLIPYKIIGKTRVKNWTKFEIFSGSRWRVKNISYRISKYPTKKRLSKEEVDRDIKKALEVWSEFTGLNFEERSSGQVHIDIRYSLYWLLIFYIICCLKLKDRSFNKINGILIELYLIEAKESKNDYINLFFNRLVTLGNLKSTL